MMNKLYYLIDLKVSSYFTKKNNDASQSFNSDSTILCHFYVKLLYYHLISDESETLSIMNLMPYV